MKRLVLSTAFAAALCGGVHVASAQSTPGTPGSTGPVRDGRSVGAPGTRAANAQYWFSDERLRRDLGLTPEQYERLVGAYSQSQTRYNESLAALDRNRSLTSTERAAQLERLQNSFGGTLQTGLKSAFTDQSQWNRFNQLQMQYQGYGAFNQPSVREQLLLSDEQLLRMNQHSQTWNTELGRLRAQYQTDPTAAQERFAAARQEALQNIGGVLTPQQQTQWQTLTGESYDFSAPTYFAADGTLIGGGNFGTGAQDGNVRPGADTRVPVQPGSSPIGDVQPGRDTAQPVQPGRNPAGPVQPGRNPAGPVQPGRNPAGSVQPGRNPGGPVQPGANTSRPVQPSVNSTRPIQPRANPTGPIQPGTNPGGPVQPRANPAGGVQPGANPAGGVQPGANPAGGVQPGANPSGGR